MIKSPFALQMSAIICRLAEIPSGARPGVRARLALEPRLPRSRAHRRVRSAGDRARTQRRRRLRLPHRHLPHDGDNIAVNQRYAERLLKFLLWQKGGYRITIAGDPRIADYLRGVYSPAGRARLRLSSSWATASTAAR